MPRIIAGGTIASGQETDGTVQRNVAEVSRQQALRRALTEGRIAREAARQRLDQQLGRLNDLEAEEIEDQRRQDVEERQQQHQQPQQQQQQEGQQQQQQEGQQQQQEGQQERLRALERRREERAGRITELRREIARQQSALGQQQTDQTELEARLAQERNRARADAPGEVETFRARFIRHVLEAQVNDPPDGAVDRMLASGYLLVRSSCDDFFSDTAVLQRDADVARDMITPILSILTGIVALRTLDEEDTDQLTHIFNLASGAGLAGISIVDRHFLFGAENVHQVRDLTFDALEAEEEHIEGLSDLDFAKAAEQLIEYQVICTPASILRLTRDAIGAGRVVADTNAGPSRDELVLEALARQLGRTGTLNAVQALALWRLYRNGADETNLPAALYEDLKTLGLDSLVLPADSNATPPLKVRLSPAGTANKAAIYQILGTFSPAARARLAEEATGDPERVGRGFADGLAPFTLPVSRSSGRRARLIVR